MKGVKDEICRKIFDLAWRSDREMTAHEQVEMLLEVRDLAKAESIEPLLFLLEAMKNLLEGQRDTVEFLNNRIHQHSEIALRMVQIGELAPRVDALERCQQNSFFMIVPIEPMVQWRGGMPEWLGPQYEHRVFVRESGGWIRKS